MHTRQGRFVRSIIWTCFRHLNPEFAHSRSSTPSHLVHENLCGWVACGARVRKAFRRSVSQTSKEPSPKRFVYFQLASPRGKDKQSPYPPPFALAFLLVCSADEHCLRSACFDCKSLPWSAHSERLLQDGRQHFSSPH